MIALDTNVLVRLFVDDGEQSATARARVAQEVDAGRVVAVPLVALVETTWVLNRTYKVKRDRIADIVDHLVVADDTLLEAPDVVAEAATEYRGSRADFADCVIAASARRMRAQPVVTFDEDASKLDGFAKL